MRCHFSGTAATQFNNRLPPTTRFGPLARSSGEVVPTLYGADSRDGTFSESIFHDVPVRGPGKMIQASRLESRVLSVIKPRRELRLAQLSGAGLSRLAVTRKELIDTEAADYAETRKWALALHEQTSCDGLLWMSRQHDESRALVLFGTRVSESDLETEGPPVSLSSSPGLDWVLEAANRAGITIVW